VLTSVSLGALAVGGCRTVTYGSFPLNACEDKVVDLATLLAQSYDYVEEREVSGERGYPSPVDAGTGPAPEFKLKRSAGAKCRNATDAAACTQRLNEVRATQGYPLDHRGRVLGYRYYVVSKGDRVSVIDGAGITFAQALAPIDTPQKAAVLAALAEGPFPACKESVRKTEDGFDVFVESTSCLGPFEAVVHVSSRGDVTTVKRNAGKSTCVG
jgi:hypothetical protein